MNHITSAPDDRRVRRARTCCVAGLVALAAGLAGCGEAPVDVTETLAQACSDAREAFAAAPTPADEQSQAEFLEASGQATQAVAGVVEDLQEQVNDVGLGDLAWQLNNFPSPTEGREVLAVAHGASAAIMRLDRLAEDVGVSQCGAPTWRPADWRALADRIKADQSEPAFRDQLNRLCVETFPNPPMLQNGTSLLNALVANPDGGGTASEDVTAQLLDRLNNLTGRQAAASNFLRDFSRDLPRLSPSENLEADYLALVAAFMGVDAVLPRVIPNEPTPEFRRRVDPAFEELDRAWGALGITC
jgi:hypothetical protein